MLQATGTISGSLSSDGSLTGRLSVNSELSGTVTVFDGDYPPYTGEYEAKPTFDTITLPTTNKYMSDDVTIHPIEVQSVSNLSGGRTVYIGGDINYG